MVSVNVLFILLAVGKIQNTESKWALSPELYCCIKCRSKHVMCEYPTLKVGQNCHHGKIRDLTHIQVEQFVDRHNYFRNNLARQAKIANMMVLKWDHTLARIAQRWAIQCILSEAKCVDTIYFKAVNVAYGEVKFKTFRETLDGYVSSVFLPKKNSSNDEEINFSNSRWASLTHFGCGYIIYRTKESSDRSVHLSCNYAPALNPNFDPYEHYLLEDHWCSKCELENQHDCRHETYVYLCNDSYKDLPVFSIVLCFIWILTCK